ncbi:hypothetical protein Lal_00038470 [Lupinus albus]|nr:hypothetical protein Lal_00038470 [Lupinus albus]
MNLATSLDLYKTHWALTFFVVWVEAGGRACLTVYMESGLALDLRIAASPETGRQTEPPRTPLARRMLWMMFGRSLILERRKGIHPDRQHPKRSLSFRRHLRQSKSRGSKSLPFHSGSDAMIDCAVRALEGDLIHKIPALPWRGSLLLASKRGTSRPG